MLKFVARTGRQRAVLTGFMLVLVPVGYWLRIRAPLPAGVRDGVGGAAYVFFWSALAWWIWPKCAPALIVSAVLLATCVLECLQLWHPNLLEAMRATLAGRLVLGTTFDLSDFPPYLMGAAAAWLCFEVLAHFLRIKS